MNTASCDMVRVADSEAVYHGAPGSFCWKTVSENGVDYIVMLAKHPGGAICMLPVNATAPRASWTWDNNEEKPTLSPSIYHNRGGGDETEWHGYFRAGRMESC